MRDKSLGVVICMMSASVMLTVLIFVAIRFAPDLNDIKPNRPTIETDERAPICCMDMDHLTDEEYATWIQQCMREEGWLDD